MSENRGGRRWVWVFGEIDGLRWVVEYQRMAFPPSAEPQVRRTAQGDRALLYTTRGAYHNPTSDAPRLSRTPERLGPWGPGKEISAMRHHPPYSEEFKQRAVQLVTEMGMSPSQVASDVGCSAQAVRNWRRQAEIDRGERDGIAQRRARAAQGRERRAEAPQQAAGAGA
jgi:transposase-like protein